MKKLACLLLLHAALRSQGQSTVINAIVSSGGNLLSGNVWLTDTAANYLAGNLFENGQLLISTTFQGTTTLHLSSLGYRDTMMVMETKGNAISLEVQMQQQWQQLGTARVTAKKLLFERTADGMLVNVENTLLSKSANAAELLARVPTVSVSGNKVSVFGRGEALLLLNGREITFENFKSLPPSDIKSVEVLTNPDARYDAKGKAVVAITMQKYFSQGVSATVVNGTTFGIFKKQPFGKHVVNAPNITLNFRKNKWDLNVYYANEYGASRMENDFVTSTAQLKKVGHYAEDNYNQSVHYYRLGIGYQLNENASISAQYDGLSHFFKLNVAQTGRFFNYDTPVATIFMTNAATTQLVNHSVNLNYNRKISQAGHTLFVGAQFNQFQNQLLDQITETIGSAGYNRINNNLNRIRMYTAQVDYSHKFKSGSLDLGLKFSHTTNSGNIKFLTKPVSASDYFSDPNLMNQNVYRELVPAAYAVYRHEFKKVSLSLGLRWEHTVAKSHSTLKNITYFSNSYSNVFPSAKVLYKLHPNWKLSASYSYKINRPLYQDMDPFLWYLDSLTSIQGNVKLQPEYLHQTEAKVHFKLFALRYNFTFSQRTIASVLMRNSANPSENAVVFTKDNIQQRTIHTVALELPFEKGHYSGYTTIAMNVYQFYDSRPQYRALKTSPQFYFSTYHSYQIPKWFTAEFTAEVYSGSFDGFTRRQPYYYFTLALSRSFLKDDALNINLMWNDLARTAIWSGTFSANTYSNAYAQRFTSSYVRLTITYNLLSKTIFNFNNKNINEAEFNRIKR
ncbi:MAG: outer membrane beta-barrel family protein [Chitinophagales bacterium]